MRNLKLSILLMGIALFAAFSFSKVSETGDDWKVPEKYVAMKNPLLNDKASIAVGKSLYVLHCKSCHGKEGLGDGTKAAQLDTHSGDFTSEAFQAQKDGSIYYKTIAGRGDMPSFEKKIPDADDIWSIVNYLRTLE